MRSAAGTETGASDVEPVCINPGSLLKLRSLGDASVSSGGFEATASASGSDSEAVAENHTAKGNTEGMVEPGAQSRGADDESSAAIHFPRGSPNATEPGESHREGESQEKASDLGGILAAPPSSLPMGKSQPHGIPILPSMRVALQPYSDKAP